MTTTHGWTRVDTAWLFIKALLVLMVPVLVMMVLGHTEWHLTAGLSLALGASMLWAGIEQNRTPSRV